MRVYRFTWGAIAAAVVGSTAVCDIASGGLGRMALVGVVVAAFGGMLVYALVEERHDRWVWVRGTALRCGVGAVATDALAVTWGRPGILVGALLVGTSPSLVALCRAQFVAWSSRRTSGPPETLAVRDLRRRWEWTTSEVLHPQASVARRLALVEERRGLLDELQRRDPEHFADWLLLAVPDSGRDRQRPRGR